MERFTMTDKTETTKEELIGYLNTSIATLNSEIEVYKKKIGELNGSKKIAEDIIALIGEAK